MQSKEAACVTEQPTVRLTGQTHLHDFVGQRAQRSSQQLCVCHKTRRNRLYWPDPPA